MQLKSTWLTRETWRGKKTVAHLMTTCYSITKPTTATTTVILICGFCFFFPLSCCSPDAGRRNQTGTLILFILLTVCQIDIFKKIKMPVYIRTLPGPKTSSVWIRSTGLPIKPAASGAGQDAPLSYQQGALAHRASSPLAGGRRWQLLGYSSLSPDECFNCGDIFL